MKYSFRLYQHNVFNVDNDLIFFTTVVCMSKPIYLTGINNIKLASSCRYGAPHCLDILGTNQTNVVM